MYLSYLCKLRNKRQKLRYQISEPLEEHLNNLREESHKIIDKIRSKNTSKTLLFLLALAYAHKLARKYSYKNWFKFLIL